MRKWKTFIFHHNLQIKSLKILQCDFLAFSSHFLSGRNWTIGVWLNTFFQHFINSNETNFQFPMLTCSTGYYVLINKNTEVSWRRSSKYFMCRPLSSNNSQVAWASGKADRVLMTPTLHVLPLPQHTHTPTRTRTHRYADRSLCGFPEVQSSGDVSGWNTENSISSTSC